MEENIIMAPIRGRTPECSKNMSRELSIILTTSSKLYLLGSQEVDFVFLYFSIFRTLGLGLEVISHISHIWWCGHNTDHGTKEKEVEGFRTK